MSRTTLSSVTLQWGAVPCIEQNGDIIGYTIKPIPGENIYYISGANITEVTIENLSASTTYSFEMAAVNNVGSGPSLILSNATTTLGIYVHN